MVTRKILEYNMKNLFKIFVIGILVLGIYSCDDFLKETPMGSYDK